jgi:hypothetical protein
MQIDQVNHPVDVVQNVPQHQLPAPIGPRNNGPLWMVSEEECMVLKALHDTVEKFLQAYLPKLFPSAVLSLHLSDVPHDREIECLKVCTHLYERECREAYKKRMNLFRTQMRRKIFTNIGTTKGYAITDTGIEFFFTGQLGEEMRCYRNADCAPRFLMPTRAAGNLRVPVEIQDYDYIITFQKPGRYGLINKIYQDGTVVRLKN